MSAGATLESLGIVVSPLGYVSTTAVADALGVNRRTVCRWVDAGRLDGFRTPTGRYRVKAEAVARLIEGRSRGALAP